MPAALASLPKGHRFPPAEFALSPEWVSEYVDAVEDAAIAAAGDGLVPPMAIAALSIRVLLEQAGLPAGAVHLGQELSFRRAVRAGERLTAEASVASRGERGGWALMGIDLAARDAAGREVMSGRATLTFPAGAEA